MGRDFLLEIGVEEMPAAALDEVREELARALAGFFEEQRLRCAEVIGLAAPRRLAAYAADLSEHQEDLVEEVRGPAIKVAFDAAGRPTQAAHGFARAQGVAVEELTCRNGYVYAVRRRAGRPTAELLAEHLPAVLEGLHLPKTMRWGEQSFRFLRPIRWLVALYGSEVVPFTVAGVVSGRHSRGHRFLAPGPVEVPAAGAYREALAAAFVVVDQEERRQRVARQVAEAAAACGGEAVMEDDLLREVTNLVEYPTAIAGSFNSQHLALPPEVLTTVMAEHQRFFPVKGADGNLLPHFIGVRDGGEKGRDLVRAGYERVLEARLVDAAFFYEEDRKEPLAARAERLKEVIFQEHLGSMYDKALRLQYLAGWLADRLGFSAAEKEAALRAAYLAKADLLTNMVYEFPELAGIMGGYYAAHQGEPAAVARAIREHYLPRAAGDCLPETPVGVAVSLADKLDTLVGYWALGITPTGSQDPYGLRRLAYGLCLLLVDKDLPLSFGELLLEAYGQYQAAERARLSFGEVSESLSEFCRQRLANILEERGIRYDVVNAVLGAGWDLPAGAAKRAEALQGLLTHPDLPSLVTVYTRARNLARNGAPAPLRPHLFRDEAESALHAALEAAREEVSRCLAAEDYRAALLALASLERPLAVFFDRVLVMTDDRDLRDNRLALLSAIVDLAGRIADLAQLRLP